MNYPARRLILRYLALPLRIGAIVLSVTPMVASMATAQLIPDATLPIASQVTADTQNPQQFDITGGTIAGTNLFHSFEQFDLSTDEIANFIGLDRVDRAILRITGDRPASIDGTIRFDAPADLFAIAANGVIFGSNAQLDTGGVVVITTADRLLFEDGVSFFADPVSASSPLLSIAVPIGLQFDAIDAINTTTQSVTQEPASITITGSGNGLTYNGDLSTNRTERPTGLTLDRGQTLGLIADRITLNSGNITAPEGRIELGAVTAGRVLFSEWRTPELLDYSGATGWGEVQLLNGASVDVSGNGGGTVQLQGETIRLIDGGVVLADTLGDATGDRIVAIAQDLVEVSGLSPFTQFSSGFYATVDPNATGNGGQLEVIADRFFVVNASILGVDTFGAGNAGRMDIRAREIDTDTSFWSGSSFSTATGSGGTIAIETDRIRIRDGSQLLAFSVAEGLAGNIIINASESIEIRGIGNGFNSTLAASGFVGSSASVGSIALTAPEIILADGAEISLATRSSSTTAPSGSIALQAESLRLEGISIDGEPSQITTSTFAAAPGANIEIDVDRLTVNDGGQITAGSFGPGLGGTIRVNAAEITIEGSTSAIDSRLGDLFTNPAGTQFPSGLFASTEGAGDAGSLQLRADTISVRNGAELAVSSIGSGNAGIVDVRADRLEITGGSQLRADSTAGFGDIVLDVADLRLRDAGRISTNTQGDAAGGNITIVSDTLIALNNSDITANAENSRGGRVSLAARGIFGTTFRDRLTPVSDITATSALGADFSGSVTIATPELDTSAALVTLEDNPQDARDLINSPCDAVRAGSTFSVSNSRYLSFALRRNESNLWPIVTPRSIGNGSTTSGLSEPNVIVDPDPQGLYDPHDLDEKLTEARMWRERQDGAIELTTASRSPFVHSQQPTTCGAGSNG